MGSGGLGAYFGGLLAHAGEDVTFIARGANLDVRATADPADVGTVDLVWNCVKMCDLDTAARASMSFDLMAGRRLELEAINGAIVRLGRQHDVPTPLNGALYAALKLFVDGAPRTPPSPHAPVVGCAGAYLWHVL